MIVSGVGTAADNLLRLDRFWTQRCFDVRSIGLTGLMIVQESSWMHSSRESSGARKVEKQNVRTRQLGRSLSKTQPEGLPCMEAARADQEGGQKVEISLILCFILLCTEAAEYWLQYHSSGRKTGHGGSRRRHRLMESSEVSRLRPRSYLALHAMARHECPASPSASHRDSCGT